MSVSGGAYNYAFERLDEFASGMMIRHPGPIYQAFGEHLLKIVPIMKDIEWIDSGDGAEDPEPKIRKLLEGDAQAVIKTAYNLAQDMVNRLQTELAYVGVNLDRDDER